MSAPIDGWGSKSIHPLARSTYTSIDRPIFWLMIRPYTFLHPLLMTRPLLLNIGRTQPLPSIYRRESGNRFYLVLPVYRHIPTAPSIGAAATAHCWLRHTRYQHCTVFNWLILPPGSLRRVKVCSFAKLQSKASGYVDAEHMLGGVCFVPADLGGLTASKGIPVQVFILERRLLRVKALY